MRGQAISMVNAAETPTNNNQATKPKLSSLTPARLDDRRKTERMKESEKFMQWIWM